MKIGVYFGNLNPKTGGGFTFEHEILHALLETESKHEFYIIIDDETKTPLKSSIGNVHIVLLGKENNLLLRNKHMRYLYRGANTVERRIKNLLTEKHVPYDRYLHAIIRKYNIDIMWFTSPIDIPVKIPYVATVWDLSHRIMPFFPEVSVKGWAWNAREQYYLRTLPRASYIITGTAVGKREITNTYCIPNERVKVVPFPVPSQNLIKTELDLKASFKYGAYMSKKYLFYPAQFWPHKNHISLLYALKILHEKYSVDFNLIFTGSDKGNQEYILTKVRELNMSEKVHILGFVSKEEIIELYRNAFALVFPTFFGPDNLPPLEAFALGCPVIASRVEGANEQFEDAALLFNPKNELEIADLVYKLYRNPNLRQNLINSGKKLAAKKNINNYIKEVITIFDDFEYYRRSWDKN